MASAIIYSICVENLVCGCKSYLELVNSPASIYVAVVVLCLSRQGAVDLLDLNVVGETENRDGPFYSSTGWTYKGE